MKNKSKLKMNLQYFANDNNQEQGNQPNDGQDNADKDKTQGNESKLPQTQGELDALINKSNQAAINNAKKGLYSEEELENKIQEALQKQKDYEGLSEDQKKQKQFEDDRKAFEAERAAFEKEKLVTQIKSDLVDKGLPTTVELDNGESFNFAELFVNDEADNTKALEAVTAFETAFNQAVAKQLKNEIKQATPGGASSFRTKGESVGSRVGKQSISNKPIFGEEN